LDLGLCLLGLDALDCGEELMSQIFSNQLPYGVEVFLAVEDVLHEVKAKLLIDYTAERLDKLEEWEVDYFIAFENIEMINVETGEEIVLVDDARKSVESFIENYIRNGKGGLNDADVISKCYEDIKEEEFYGYEEEH
jgi:hypothetical protein